MEFDDVKYMYKPPSIGELLYQQVQEQADTCDVIIQVGQWEKKFHWCVLVYSPFFESIRRNNFIERQTGRVKLNIASPLTTETAILFLYGKEPKLTEENVASILELADFLLIPSLKSACVSFLKTLSVKEDNCMTLLALSSLYDFDLKNVCNFIRAHLHKILKLDEAKHLTKESVIGLMKDPLILYVTAEEKFTFVVNWVSQFCQSKQQNYDQVFAEVFQSIDITTVSKDFLETVVLQHPIANEIHAMFTSHYKFNNLQQHRVLVFPKIMNSLERIACFDLETERWCGVAVGITEDDTIGSLGFLPWYGGFQEPSEMYTRCTARDCKIFIRDLNLKSTRVITVKTQDNTGYHMEFDQQPYCMEAGMFVTVSNQCKKIIKQAKRVGLDFGDPRFHAYTRQSTFKLDLYMEISTLYCGRLEFPDTTVYPVLSIPKAYISSVCINDCQVVGLLSNDKLYIYDISNCQLETITLYYDPLHPPLEKLKPKEKGGFICNNNMVAIIISRADGPTPTRRYILQTVDLECFQLYAGVKYTFFYNSGTWFRFRGRSRPLEAGFSCLSHEELIHGNTEELEWMHLPYPAELVQTLQCDNVFMISLPRSMVNCHIQCPHCKQSKQLQTRSQRYTLEHEYSYYDHEDDVYDDGDNDTELDRVYDEDFDDYYDDMEEYNFSD